VVTVPERVSRRAGFGKPLAVVLASLADEVSTTRGIRRGGVERNPALAGGATKRRVVKGLVTASAATSIWAIEKRGHKGWARVLTFAAVGYYGVLVARNLS
jgi:hypothetical protein